MTSPAVDRAQKAVDPADWIRGYHKASPGAPTLVCFPHAGGSASYYHPVSAALVPDVRVLAVQYPGRQDRRNDPCVDNMADLADLIDQALASMADTGPVAFFGHSMGAVLAFEVARRFEARGVKAPSVVMVSGRRAPSRYKPEDVHTRDLAGIVEEMKSLGGTDSRVLSDPELLEMVVPALRADYQAVSEYQYTDAVVTSPIVIMTADDDPRTDLDDARAWAEHTSGGAEFHVFHGGHFYLEKQQAEVLGRIRQTLETYL